ncbi:myeloid differentiation primary response protein MyD88-like [Saccostrea echinata]|uniref:myeloid differentiation primary response protein MyD88-like n=1 Tax=Saccostrea echinata TaxID=191078 RepID=UPI002A7FD8F9|nr:myeloid differentiation primary response protein MyD88-like [Saccostrea echinata]
MDDFEYDAFVVYNPFGEDQQFVNLMTRVLTSPPYNLRLYVPWSDEAEESLEAVATAESIEKRCKKVLVVISAASLESDLFHFHLKVAHSMSPGARRRKVIPIRLDQTEVPAVIRFTTSCDYYKRELRVFVWDRLNAAFTDSDYTYKSRVRKTASLPEKRKLPDLIPTSSPLKRVQSWWRLKVSVI